MRLARLRRFAWMLVLVLSAGLAAPALASSFEAGLGRVPTGSHVHPDGSVHADHVAPATHGVQKAGAATTPKAPLHCPGCATAAECAVSCFGVCVLPGSILMPATSPLKAWATASLAEPVGVAPSGDLDPPRPVSVR